MLDIKNAWKSVIRTPVKSLLFFLLLFIVTIFLCLGIGMWDSANRMLKQVDKNFTTVGYIDYIGGMYPYRTSLDPVMQKELASVDWEKLKAKEQVIDYEEYRSVRGYIETFQNKFYSPYYYKGVVIFKAFTSTLPGENTTCLVTNSLYTFSGKNDIFIYMRPSYDEEGNPLELESGRLYAAVIEFARGSSSKAHFYPVKYQGNAAKEAGFAPLELPMIIDITEEFDGDIERFLASDAGKELTNIAQTYRVIHNSIDVVASRSVETLETFYTQQFYLVEGSMFTEEDYKTGKACLISQRIADQIHVKIGDTIPLALQFPVKQYEIYDSYWPERGFAAEENFIVRGIFKDSEVYDYTVYIPNVSQPWMERNASEYAIAKVILKNGSIPDFQEAVKELLPNNIRIAYNDNGYTEAVIPVKSIFKSANLMIQLSVLCGLVTLLLFGLLFVLKQRESAEIMIELGAGSRHVRLFLLAGGLIIILLAAIAGVIIGYRFSGGVVEQAYLEGLNSMQDIRFSDIGFGILSETIDLKPEVSISSGIFAFGATVISAVIICFVFTEWIIREMRPSRKQKRELKRRWQEGTKIEKPANKRKKEKIALWHHLPTMSFRHAVASCVRGGLKSLIVPFVSFFIVILVCMLGIMMSSYQKQRAEVYDQIPVLMYFTSLDGKAVDNLILDQNTIDSLLENEFIEEAYLGKKFYYIINPSSLDVGGTIPYSYKEPSRFENLSYGIERAYDNIMKTASYVVFLNEVRRSSEFMFTSMPIIEYMEGYDEQQWRNDRKKIREEIQTGSYDYSQPIPGIVSSNLLSKELSTGETFEIGDVISISVVLGANGSELDSNPHKIRIVGSFAPVSEDDNIYLPFELMNDTEPFPINSASFKLKNTNKLSEFKDYLEKNGYGTIRKMGFNRMFVVTKDAELYKMITKLDQHIMYMKLIYPIVLCLLIGIGFIISYLMTKNRKSEFAIIRSIGGGKWSSFFCFLEEQALLLLAGVVPGVILVSLISGGDFLNQLAMTAIYIICYLTGSAIAVGMMCRIKVLDILTQKE